MPPCSRENGSRVVVAQEGSQQEEGKVPYKWVGVVVGSGMVYSRKATSRGQGETTCGNVQWHPKNSALYAVPGRWK